MVAKSYQSLEIITEPYTVKGRMYVKVLTAAGSEKQVRWYADWEYKKMYPEDASKAKPKTQKEALGFGDGYITIFKGDTYPLKEWFKENGAKYTKFWGWSFGTFAEMPEDLPAGVEPIRLEWSLVGDDNGRLKSDSAIQEAIEEILYDESPSGYVGEIGEKIERDLRIKQTIQLEGYYGVSTMHIMEDEDENIFVWVTAARSLNEGEWYRIRGTIKDHRKYKHTKQTVLTRCKAEAL